MTKSRGINRPKALWTPEQDEILQARYPHELTENLTGILDKTVLQIYSRAVKFKLKKTAEFLASRLSGRLDGIKGSDTRFQKGHNTWNKDMKGLMIGGEATQFKPGQMPHNHLPVGTVVKDTEGYMKVKVAEPKQWEFLHIKTWREAHGPISKGSAVIFKDKNRENCALDNLELVTRAELMRRNSYHNYGKEIAQLVQLKGAITRQINKRERNHK